MSNRTFHKVSGLRTGESIPKDWKPTLYFVDMKDNITAVFTDTDRAEQEEKRLKKKNDNLLQGELFVFDDEPIIEKKNPLFDDPKYKNIPIW